MKTTTCNWLCPECDLRIEVPTVEQIERLRTEHVRAEHPEYLDEVDGRIDVPVQMIDARLHYGDEDIAWVACRLCGEREEIPISPAIYRRTRRRPRPSMLWRTCSAAHMSRATRMR